jgi:uroporphyrinogen-III decarboxylase
MNRRKFLTSSAMAAGFAVAGRAFAINAAETTLSHKERVDRALAGKDVDRPPFTFYHHYKRPTAAEEAQDHLEFHRAYKTDIVKVMNDFDYPHSTTGNWWELKPLRQPYPDQLKTLEIVGKGLNGDAYFIDTLYGPYMTAMILFQSQPQYKNQAESDRVIHDLHEFQLAHPDHWHTAMEAITQSTINHVQQSKALGASGALVSVFNAEKRFGSVDDYAKYTRLYDKRLFDSLSGTRLSVLHLHYLERPYLDQFTDFHAPVLQYSVKTSGIPVADFRKIYSQPFAGGVDEIDFRKLTVDEMRSQWEQAQKQAGKKYIAAPGCSVPNDSTPHELARFPESLHVKLNAG